MKSFLKQYSLLLMISLFMIGNVKANDEDQEPKIKKEKTYSKTYAVSGSDRVSFDNRFGELKINTWDKNEVKVDILMVGKANSEDVAQEVLDRISIEDGKNGSGVYFKTKIGDDKKNWPKGEKYNNTGFTINYVVYMPSKNPLNAENEFGKMILPNYDGEITVQQKFGTLTAGKLSNVKKIRIEFSGGSTVESINGGQLTIAFSRTQVNKLEGNVNVNVEHSGGVKLVLDNSIKQLTVKNSFTDLLIDVPSNLSANFDVHTNFSELDNNTSFAIKEIGEDNERRGPKFDKDYSGKAGSGNTPIKIRSEFGEVTIGHNISFDVTEKEKKAKKKTRSV